MAPQPHYGEIMGLARPHPAQSKPPWLLPPPAQLYVRDKIYISHLDLKPARARLLLDRC